MSQLNRSQIYEVAQGANVSVNQVVKVLLKDKAITADVYQRIYKTIDVMGFDDAIKSKIATGVIGVLAPPNTPGDFIYELVRCVNSIVISSGYLPVVQVRTEAWDDQLINLLEPGGIAGIVALIPADETAIVDICRQFLCPYVFHDRDENADQTAPVPFVRVDNYGGMRVIMQHLFELGHERIGYITGGLDQSAARIRLQAYEDALADAGIPYDDRLIGVGNWEHALAYQNAMRMLRQSPRPTAIAAANDLSAFGVIQAARELHLDIGHDLSITGFDDMPLAETVSPPLTTMRQPTDILSQTIVEMLLSLINGEGLSTSGVEMDAQLIVRESTGPVQK